MADLIDTDSETANEFDYQTLRASVREEIHVCINPFKDVDRKPPFSTPELLVMAVLCSDEEGLSFTELMRWIVTTFQ